MCRISDPKPLGVTDRSDDDRLIDGAESANGTLDMTAALSDDTSQMLLHDESQTRLIDFH